MNELQISAVIVLVLVLCQGIKMAGLNSRYIPLLAALLGIAGAVAFSGGNWLLSAYGIILGLSTSGLYDLGKKTILGK